ncbi:MAG: tetratricopeptide repeat protein [Lewinellaceae bacterium]|nr:tetratricopeptide repeat protein [Lewinellaceae bacterium]
MDNTQLLTEVKQLIGKAETGKALEKLIAFLESAPRFQYLYQEALQAQALFKKAERDESFGLVSAEQSKLSYSRTTQQLLQLVGRLERNELGPFESSPAAKKRRYAYWAIGALLLALAAFGGWWLLKPDSSQGENLLAEAENCPAYPADDAFNILLFPFQDLEGQATKPHIAINSSLSQFKEQFDINCEIGFYKADENDPNSFPTSYDDAGRKASSCHAKLVIWGTSGKSGTGGTTIQMFYKFLDENGKLPLSKLGLTEEATQVVTVPTISSIVTEGNLTQSLEENIKLLFGLIAHESGDKNTAIEMLESFEANDSSTTLVKGMVLADNYWATNQEDKALASYDTVLATHPNYFLARNNRGILLYKNEKYVEAAEDLSVALEKDTTDPQLLELRSDAYIKTEQLDKAKADLSRLQRLPPEERHIDVDKKLNEVNKKIEEQRQIKAEAESSLRHNPANTSALLLKAESSHKLGEYAQAIQAAETMLRNDPRNLRAFAQLIIAYRSQGDREKTAEAIRRADAAGVSRAELSRLVPFDLNEIAPIRTIIDRPVLRRQ